MSVTEFEVKPIEVKIDKRYICSCGTALVWDAEKDWDTGRYVEDVPGAIFCLDGEHYAHKTCCTKYSDCCDVHAETDSVRANVSLARNVVSLGAVVKRLISFPGMRFDTDKQYAEFREFVTEIERMMGRFGGGIGTEAISKLRMSRPSGDFYSERKTYIRGYNSAIDDVLRLLEEKA